MSTINNSFYDEIAMKLQHIAEARAHADKNPKVSLNSAIDSAVKQTTDKVGGSINLFVSFTELDKLGINPSSTYNTPIGIYAYPAKYVQSQLKGGKDATTLPFAGASEYANIFKISGVVVNVSTCSSGVVAKYLTKLDRILGNGEVQQSLNRFDDDRGSISSDVDDGNQYYTGDAPGAKLWWVILDYAKRSSHKPHVRANNIWRQLGVDAVMDNGDGIIHPGEPTQVVVFNPTSIINNKRVHNRHSPDRVRFQQAVGQANRQQQSIASSTITAGPNNEFTLQSLMNPTDSLIWKYIAWLNGGGSCPELTTKLAQLKPRIVRYLAIDIPDKELLSLAKADPRIASNFDITSQTLLPLKGKSNTIKWLVSKNPNLQFLVKWLSGRTIDQQAVTDFSTTFGFHEQLERLTALVHLFKVAGVL